MNGREIGVPVARFLRERIPRLVRRLLRLQEVILSWAPLPKRWCLAEVGSLWKISSPGGPFIYLPARERVKFFRYGIEPRLTSLCRQYNLDKEFFEEPRVMVDVGANVGEFGLLVEAGGGRYVAFEPDPHAFAALELNVTSGELFQLAIGTQRGVGTLYLSTASADTSLIPPLHGHTGNLEVDVHPLDEILSGLERLDNIDLLKIEAEGFEPEVIRGAIQTIKKSGLVVVDAGPERQGVSTMPAVVELMTSFGFVLRQVSFPRGVATFSASDTPN